MKKTSTKKPVKVIPKVMEFEGRIVEIYKKKSGLYTLIEHFVHRDVDQETMNRIIKKEK